jgi:glycosyltransferase involved in cell wall biosynthesis
MIVRDCADDLEVALKSIHEHVDEIVIVDTGSLDHTKDVARKYTDKVFDFEWIDDFAAARNFSFSKTSHDLVMWLDSDDEVISGRQVCEDAKLAFAAGINQIRVRYDYEFDKNGFCRLRQMRERFVDKTIHEWRSPIHECLCANFTLKQGVLNPALGYIKHRRRISAEKLEQSADRNLRICQKMEQEGKLETRTLYYYGNALQKASRFEESLEMFLRYIPQSGVPNEKYSAMVKAAICNEALGRRSVAKQQLGAAILEFPELPSAYLLLADIFAEEQDYYRAQLWANETILHQKGIDGENVADPARIMGRPHVIKSFVLLHQSNYKEAQEEIRKAEEYLGDDDDVNQLKEELMNIEFYGNQLKAFLELTGGMRAEGREEDARALARIVPEVIKRSPPVCQLLPRERPQGKATIAIVCPHQWEYWGPDSLQTGIGGSEEAVIHTSRRLVKEGFHVEVYAYTKTRQDDQGVAWFPAYEFDGSADAVIFWRAPSGPIDYGLKAKRSYLWLHDIPDRGHWIKDFSLLFDRVITLSDYHRELHSFVPDELIFPWQNGIDVASLPEPRNEPGRLIYASCPTRGLLNILKFWRYIHDACPKAELHTYYGWNAVALAHKKQNPMMERTYQEIERLKEQDGIYWHGRVGQPELHEAFARSQIWVYPTNFPEISCITGMKAQALGCQPIVNGFAAVKETVRFGEQLPELDMGASANQKKFADLVITHLKNPELFTEREEMIRWSRQTYSWDRCVKELAEVIRSDLAEASGVRQIVRGQMPRRSRALVT